MSRRCHATTPCSLARLVVHPKTAPIDAAFLLLRIPHHVSLDTCRQSQQSLGPTDQPRPRRSRCHRCLQCRLPARQYANAGRCPNLSVATPAESPPFGHPNLIHYLQHLVTSAHNAGLPPLLIGDMAMVKGGPFTSGHRSHQSGLDADLWFRFAQPRLSSSALRNPQPLDMVAANNREVSKSFTRKQALLLQLAASAP